MGKRSYTFGEDYQKYTKAEFREKKRGQEFTSTVMRLRKERQGIKESSESKNCDTKTAYRSEKHAHDVIRSVERKRNVKLRAYHCGTCFGWHITSAKKQKWIEG